MRSTLITCYINPDLDGVAGAIAYGEFLRKKGMNVVVGIIGKPNDEVKYIFSRFGFEYPRMIEGTDDFDEVILIDASDLNSLEGKVAREKVVEIIDHRSVHEVEMFPRAKVQIELVGAAATLVAERFVKNKVDISRESAILMYGAIISCTLNLRGSVTTERDKKVAKWLNKIAELPKYFWKDLFMAKSDLSGGKLVENIEGDFAWFTIGGKKIGIAQLEIMGTKEVVCERCEEIVSCLESIKSKMGLDDIFLNIIDLEYMRNFIITRNIQTQKILEKVLNVEFVGAVAKRLDLMMRKQIVPLLKEELEK